LIQRQLQCIVYVDAIVVMFLPHRYLKQWIYSSMTLIGEFLSGEHPSKCSGIVRAVSEVITIHVVSLFALFLLSVLFLCSSFKSSGIWRREVNYDIYKAN